MNRASSPTGWVRNPVMKSPELDPTQASSYELGWTYNPFTGCRNHVNGLCLGGGFPCYAYRLAHGRLKQRYLANTNLAPGAKGGVSTLTIGNRTVIERESDYADPFYPRFWDERLEELRHRNNSLIERGLDKPRGIFLCDMGELFGDWLPMEWVEAILTEVDNKHDRFYLLTKQPQNLARWSPFPDNCYVGVTATNTQAFVKACNHLVHVKAKVIYLSLEPLLEWHITPDVLLRGLRAQQINWLIIGAQTKPTVLPTLESLRGIVEAADKAGIPVHLKDNLLELVNYHSPETEFAFNKDGSYRQEMPEEVKQCKGS